jgi:hypothetical protein
LPLYMNGILRREHLVVKSHSSFLIFTWPGTDNSDHSTETQLEFQQNSQKTLTRCTSAHPVST